MTDNNITAYGILETRPQAEACVNALLDSGYAKDDISLLADHETTTRDFSANERKQANDQVSEGTAAGATAGTVIGGALGLLAGVGTFAIPGAGPFLAAGPVMATLAGMGAGAAVGGVAGALAGSGVPEYDSARYEALVKNGGIFIAVHCDTAIDAGKAKTILENNDAEEVSAGVEPIAAPARFST